METVDLSSWPRRELFEFFSPISNPFYALSFRLDVTKLRSWTKERGLSPARLAQKMLRLRRSLKTALEKEGISL